MKLELKHLSAYLPYRLKVQHHAHPASKFEVYGIDIHKNHILNIVGEATFSLNVIKPILRPLSDINPSNHGYASLTQIKNGLDDGTMCINVYQNLLQNHFDVFGLINSGLAIDINTITT